MTVQSLSRTAPTNEGDRLIYFGIASFGAELLESPNPALLLYNAPLLSLLANDTSQIAPTYNHKWYVVR